ncbi:cytochrome c-type biogenesis protein [Marinomonas algarum]|uniref:Cytochrome c-type biogenesis protein n=1 Tax=Marinomonas algarum TaxID=2883105 RepID=A0A9X1IML0_9GAMM|nr:cytochrome c-type biogenesis protein [Marinomonas algarum]MCB5162000.1 cytochrome c-type biogenesis protein CcmH [Marinomonas algarum]
MKNAFQCVVALMFFCVLPVSAEQEMDFRSELHKTRFQSLVMELRCPKCQNQNLSDSESSIAIDLREQIFQMIEQGKTDQEVVDYMVARYGTFVLYRPQHSSATFLLWYGPFILLALGLVAFIVVVVSNRKRKGQSS